MSQERDTHFKHFAEGLYPALKTLFTACYERRFYEDEQGMEQVIEQIKLLLAQHGYDLVMHTIDSLSSYAYDVCTANEQLMDWVPDIDGTFYKKRGETE